MNNRILLIAVIALIAIGLLAFVVTRSTSTIAVAEPTTFEECAALYPVMESYPAQCKTPGGTTFVEEVTPPMVEEPAPTPVVGIPDLITVATPSIGQRVSSPLVVTGSARGTWYFEASFPVEVRNAAGTVLGVGVAQADGEWMTENFVDFRAEVTFPTQPNGTTGFVVLHKDNPSGDPIRDQSVEIPITF